MIHKLTHVTDLRLTQELARQELGRHEISVTWYTNQTIHLSVGHSHPYYEMVLPISGEVRYSIDGNLYDLHPGELMCIPEGVWHFGRHSTANGASERIVVQIDSDLWHHALQEAGLGEEGWSKETLFLSREAIAAWDVRGLFERIALASAMKPSHKALVYNSQLTELQLIMDQIVEANDIEPPAAASLLAARAIEYIQARYQDPDLTVTTVADHMFVSREHLSRTFKAYTMESVHSYITALRMQDCRRAIAEGSPLLRACTESGFSDYSSFFKSFRRLYGMTPAEYRRQLKAPGL